MAYRIISKLIQKHKIYGELGKGSPILVSFDSAKSLIRSNNFECDESCKTSFEASLKAEEETALKSKQKDILDTKSKLARVKQNLKSSKISRAKVTFQEQVVILSKRLKDLEGTSNASQK